MIEWLKRALGISDASSRMSDTFDALTAHVSGGPPEMAKQILGHLDLRSDTLAFGDPQSVAELEISGIDSSRVTVSALVWKYPAGAVRVAALTFNLGKDLHASQPQKVGQIGIDSAALVVADKADIDDYWTETGEARIGVISRAPDDTLLHDLKSRFNLETVMVNRVRAEIVGSVSGALEKEIEAYLKSVPEYSKFPYMHFHVQTNNSFERANFMDSPWGFMPIGSSESASMFVCTTGRGDGTYDVHCRYSGSTPRVVSIDFMADD